MSWDWMEREAEPMREGFDVMQVCLNGHQISAFAQSQPEFSQAHCSDCGARTISACEKCNTPIRGHYHSPGVLSLAETPVPKYCFRCGTAYPWQVAALENLEGILKEGGLSEADMQEATIALPDVVQDTPKTQLASLKFKRLLGKLGKPIYDVAIKVVSDIASETAKKTMGLG